MTAEPSLTTVVFDLGGVVLSWAPERAFAQVLPTQDVPAFMTKINFADWNRRHDGGLRFDLGEQELIERFPTDAEAVRAYRTHFASTLSGMVEGTGAIMAELQQAGIRLLGLTNWSGETFPVARKKFGLLQRLEDILVSGDVGLAKPDPAIFELLAERFEVRPAEAVFIDDAPRNVAAAGEVGFTGIAFTDANRLRQRLVELGLLAARQPVGQPIFHLTQRQLWQTAQQGGAYVWSSRDLSYLAQGFVHCSFRAQLSTVAERLYADVPAVDLLVLELDPDALAVPVVVENLDAGAAFPHLYGELPLEAVVAVHGWPM